MKLFFSLLIILSFVSCGYKPSAKFSRGIVGEKISTSITISAHDPENTVIIKDAVDQAVIEVFHASLCDRKTSTTHLALSIAKPSYTPIVYDDNGFVVGYRMMVHLNIIKYHSGVSKKYHAVGTHDFTVEPNAVVTDQVRFEAIKYSSEKAIRSFVAQVSAEGARAEKSK
ncbi:MAG: hypothetical protein U9N33_08010 [Campylobacterota bacterium]|nr:hypothetical protein [Campylobacterota bacterium]